MTLRSSIQLVTALSFALLGATACKPDYPACKKDKHCKQELGESCVDGTCQNCQADADCVGKGPEGADFVCYEFRCTDPSMVPEGGAGNGEMGDPCAQKTDCVGGLVCTAGQCSACTDDVQCAPSTCTIETGRCAAAGQCQVDDDCPIDEICDGGICVFSGDIGDPDDPGPCGISAVYFGFDDDTITPAAQEKLTSLATCIAENGGEVVLEAHADSVGTEEYNILLTERRGRNVKKALASAGAPDELMSVLAKGNLEASGSTESERAKDRRVQFIWTRSGGGATQPAAGGDTADTGE